MTPKQQRFAEEYLVDLNAERAAIRAGYSPKYARGNAHKLVAKGCIATEITKRRAAISEKLEITQEKVIQALAAIAFANITDYLAVKTERAEKLCIHPITGEAVMLPADRVQHVKVMDTDEIPPEMHIALAGIRQGRYGIEIKLYDKIRALALLCKHLGLFSGGDTGSTQAEENNLFDAIVGSACGVIVTDDIPELSAGE